MIWLAKQQSFQAYIDVAQTTKGGTSEVLQPGKYTSRRRSSVFSADPV